MFALYKTTIIAILFRMIPAISAQEEFLCYSPGSIAASVIITIIVTLLLLYLVFLTWKRWKIKKEKHLVLENDPEKGNSSYAFDNDGFTDGASTPHEKTIDKSNKLDSVKSKWSHLLPLGALMTKNEKQKTLDDSALQKGEIKRVALKSHDFTGLGFNVYGNMRDGIFIKDILNRGPAFESGKLNQGDRIKSVTINFEHVVYEDALTILSYASPYEVVLEAQSGKIGPTQTPTKTIQLGHPLYKSSSTTDLFRIQKTSKKRLFPLDDSSPYSSQQKLRGTTTLERSSPNHVQTETSSPEQLKTQLEEKLVQNHKQQLRTKDEIAMEPPKTENKYQKFGIKVLPVELKTEQSPKANELSQNDNNINLERTTETFVDEVDRMEPPPVKKREKNNKGNDEGVQAFVRQGSTGGSGIKRDENGIPQEIPSHMLNAAVAARRNRRPSDDNNIDDVKSPKKQKGRAPAPPQANSDPQKELSNYASDSDIETDNQSSVNTIELNASDITIHQTEESEDMQNRRTASTGDLTKIQKVRKMSTSTLERAQSLDITDAAMPTLKRKAGSVEDNYDNSKSESDDSLYGKALVHKEPRLSLALDGLNTFQRSRLKKSTEWGNLEDAIVSLEKDDGENSSQFDALVNKINEIKQESEVVEEPAVVTTFEVNETELEKAIDENGVDHGPGTHSVFVAPEVTDTEVNLNKPKSMDLHLNYGVISEKLLLNERHASDLDPFYNLPIKIYDTNIPDDIKVSRHSLESLEKVNMNGNISNITITNKNNDTRNSENGEEEFYTTALDMTLINENKKNSINNDRSLSSPDSIQNSILSDTVTVEGPTSLTVEVNDISIDSQIQHVNISPTSSLISVNQEASPKSNYSLTYITEIQVLTPNTEQEPESEAEPVKKQQIENYIKNFESNIKQFESHIQLKNDPEKELHKIQEIAEEQLKKLPEMRFTTSSYEAPKSPETYPTQIEQLRSNFEKSPSKTPPKETISKSRIPVATSKTPPTSPERRDSRNFDLEIDKDIIAIMSSPMHSTPLTSFKYQPKVVNKNVSITSIRSSSKIPSGLQSRPPVPPRKYDINDGISTNGNTNNSFKQWVFNPDDSSITNITVTENKMEHK